MASHACDRKRLHPLEIIPVFQRYPYSPLRDVVYTFIWNVIFGLAFFVLSALFQGHVPAPRMLGATILVANFIGYSIHLLYFLGGLTRIDRLAERAGAVVRVVYYSGVPLVGVYLGFWLSSFVVDVGLRRFLHDAGTLLTMLSIGLVISVVLSVVFFWRERSAAAEAQVARERERAERVERAAVSANLRALQAQIEPHFLFNTLANVAGLIDPEPATARRMLESFIRFLRASLEATRMATTTLGAEGDLIAAYLDVLQVRMGERLRYRIEIPEALRGFALPPMLLQPVVENAIRHGLEPKVAGGEVLLRARREGAQVVVEVEDGGVGFASTTRGGVGLANLRERLKALYGDAATVRITERAGGGTLVALGLPA